jgi:hypothetical protein
VDCVYVLRQDDGEVVTHAENLAGNLAAAHGCLIVAGPSKLAAYLADGLLLKQRQDEAAQPGASIWTRRRPALVTKAVSVGEQKASVP